jgi:hypothetical protein
MPPGAAIADVSGAIIVLAALRSNPNLRSRAFRAVTTEESPTGRPQNRFAWELPAL